MATQASTSTAPSLGGTTWTWLCFPVPQANLSAGTRDPTMGYPSFSSTKQYSSALECVYLFWVREGASHQDKCRPCPASPQQLGVRQGLRHLVRIFRATSLRRHLPTLLRSEKAREKLMGELQRHCWANPLLPIPAILQRLEGKILQGVLY